MLTRHVRKRVAICLSPDRHQEDHDPIRRMARELGNVVATYVATPPINQGREAKFSPLLSMMFAANRYEFDVVVADFKLVCTSPWEVSRVMGRLQDLGIEAVDTDQGPLSRLEGVIRSLVFDTKPRDHGRRVRAAIAAARARRTTEVVNGKDVKTTWLGG